MLFFQHSCGVETGWKLRCCQMNRTKHLMVLIHFYLFIMWVCVFTNHLKYFHDDVDGFAQDKTSKPAQTPICLYTGWTVASSQLVWDLTTAVITSSVRLWLGAYRQQAESSFSHKRVLFLLLSFLLVLPYWTITLDLKSRCYWNADFVLIQRV